VVIAGCGGSSKKASTTSATTTETTATTTENTTSTSTTGGSSFASAKNCEGLVGLSKQYANALSGSTGTSADLQQAGQLLQQFAAAAPGEIRPDFELYAAAFAKFATGIQGAMPATGQPATPAQAAQLQKALANLMTPELQAASGRIAAWVSTNCPASVTGTTTTK